MGLLLAVVTLMTAEPAAANRTVQGRITDLSGAPRVGVRVQAWDSDTGADDLMGTDYTDAGGYYTITYADGHWDPGPHGITTWRPDIYIRVFIRGSDGDWERVYTSGIRSNWKLRDDLTINAATRGLPTVYGYVTREIDGSAVAGAEVIAMDSDWGFDDFLGSGHTDSEGNYLITFSRRDWDSGTGRPDVYVEVYINDERRAKSPTRNGYNMENALAINVAIPKPKPRPEPAPPPVVATGDGTNVTVINASGETRFFYHNGNYTDLLSHGGTTHVHVPCNTLALLQAKDELSDTFNAVTWELGIVGACLPDALELTYQILY